MKAFFHPAHTLTCSHWPLWSPSPAGFFLKGYSFLKVTSKFILCKLKWKPMIIKIKVPICSYFTSHLTHDLNWSLTWVNPGVLSVGCWTLCVWLRSRGSAWRRAGSRGTSVSRRCTAVVQLWTSRTSWGSGITLQLTNYPGALMPQKAKPPCLISAPRGCGVNEVSSLKISDQ